MENVLSPIDNKSETKVIDSIKSLFIIERYNTLNMDVNRFFKGNETITIRECEKTGYRFYHPFHIMGDDTFYQDLQAKSDDYYPQKKWEHIEALKFIKKDQSVLEVGCATGYFLNQCTKKGATATGLELNQKAANEAISKGLDVQLSMLGEHIKDNKNKYDIICSFQVLEHITDVESYFSDALKCLKPGGKIILGVPNNNPYIFKHDKFHILNLPPHHAGLWNRKSFEKTAEIFNLDINSIKVSPLFEYKDWYKAQIDFNRTANPFLGFLLTLIPRPLYKIILKAFSKFIDGKTLFVVFEKSPVF